MLAILAIVVAGIAAAMWDPLRGHRERMHELGIEERNPMKGRIEFGGPRGRSGPHDPPSR